MSLRKILNKRLKRYGYEIVRLDQFRDRFNECLIEEYDSSENFCFVQIGANDGVKFDDLYSFVTTRKCMGIVVEPLKVYFDMLVKNYSEYPDIVPINCAVHQTQKKAILHYVDPAKLDSLPEWAQGIGSLDPNHHMKSGTPPDSIVSEEVECVHLMDLIREQKFEQVNLLQIDVEGYDGEVIKMIDFNVVKPKIIKYEHQNLKKEERKQIVKMLKSHGYTVFRQGGDTVAINS